MVHDIHVLVFTRQDCLHQFHSVYISEDVLDHSRLNTGTRRGDEEGETAQKRRFKMVWVSAKWALGHTSDSWCERYLSEIGARQNGRKGDAPSF